MRSRFLAGLAFAAICLTPAIASAQTVTPTNPQGWGPDAGHTQNGGTAQISGDQPRSGNGSLELSLPDGSAASAYSKFFTSVSLGAFQSASFDWFRDGSSTVAGHLGPVFTFDIAYTDMGSGTPTFGQLEWEPVYNGYSTAPVNTWTTSNLTDGDWWVQGGLYGQTPTDRGPLDTNCGDVNNSGGTQAFMTIAAWSTSSCLANASVYGVGIQAGSGWSGMFLGDADNVAYAFGNGPSGNYNFETDNANSTVPEPGTMAMLAMGLVGMAGAARRRRRNG